MADLTFIYLILAVFSCNRGYGQIRDVRLVNGTKPSEGTIMYTEDCQIWKTSCGPSLSRTETNVICRHLGYAGTNWVINNSSFGGPSPTSNITCNGDENSVSNCSLEIGCANAEVGGAVCYENNYLGCFIDIVGDRALRGPANKTFSGLTIDKCLEFCRQYSEMLFAGVQYTWECFCSDATSDYSRHGRVPDDECDYRCHGSQYERCGGCFRIAVFDLTTDPHLPPNPTGSPCNMTTPPAPMTMAITQSTYQPTTSQGTSSLPGVSMHTDTITSHGGPTSSIETSLTGTVAGPGLTSASSTPPVGTTTTTYAAIGGGVASAVVVCIIVIILVYRCKCKPNQNQTYGYGLEEVVGGKAAPPTYETTIVAFPEASGSDSLGVNMKDDQQSEIEKDASTLQMKKRRVLADYENMKGRDNTGFMKPENTYENMADDARGKTA